MVKLSLCAMLALLGSFHLSQAQSNRKIVNQPIEWFAIASNLKLNNNLTLMAEGQFRYADDFDPQQYQLRTALDIKLNDHFSVVPLGYVFTWNYKYGKQPAVFANNEHRIWQQLFFKHSIRSLKVDHRLRLEERFIQVHSISTEGNIIDEGYNNKQTRLRYRLMARLPINGANIQAGTYFISVYDEIFMSWGDRVTYHDPDQNRAFAGLGYQFDKRLTIQGGFLYQMLIKANGALQENNLGFQIQATYNIDCTKH